MRIWYQSFTVIDKLRDYRETLQNHLCAVARPDVEVVVHGMPAEAYGEYAPTEFVSRVALASYYARDFMANARRAEAEGYDAFAIGHLPDLALRECRSLVDIPVVGLGEAAMRTACYLGDRFSIICFINDAIPLYQRNIDDYGLRSKAGPILAMELSFEELMGSFKSPETIASRFLRLAEKAIDANADVLIPGEGVLAECLRLAGVNRVGDVPVLDVQAALVKACESLADLRRISGVYVNRRGFFFARPRRELMEHAARFHGHQVSQSGSTNDGASDCPGLPHQPHFRVDHHRQVCPMPTTGETLC